VKCSKFLNELNDFLDGSLDSSLKAELEEHLTWCHNCHVVCNTTKKTIEIYRENQVYELPDTLRVKLQTAIIAKCKSSKSKD
jgi:predicted anti-sigma-YlaC factor YlaD